MVYFWRSSKCFCVHSREDVKCEILGICTLVRVNHNFSNEELFYFSYQDIYTTSIVSKYLDTVTFKTSTKFYNTNLPSAMIFTKADVFTSDGKVEKLTSEFNIYH